MKRAFDGRRIDHASMIDGRQDEEFPAVDRCLVDRSGHFSPLKRVKFSRQLEQADAVEAPYVHAEAATRGNMVNAKGRARGINPRTLITGRGGDVPPVRLR